jgi:hypothetical protein
MSNLPNPKDIAEGYTNLARKKIGFAKPDIEQIAVLRENVCNTCTDGGNRVLVSGKCTKCGCVMEAKWRALNAKCIIGKW